MDIPKALAIGAVLGACVALATFAHPRDLSAAAQPGVTGVLVCQQQSARLDPQELAPSEIVAAVAEQGSCTPPQTCCIRSNCNCGVPPNPMCCDGTCACECITGTCCPQ